MKLRSRFLNSYPFLIVTLASLFAGCSLSFGPSNTLIRPTPTTLATVWNILEQRPLLIPPLPQNKNCPATNDTVMPYVGFTAGHAIVTADLTDIPFASPKTLANGQPNPHNNGWYLQKVIWMIPPPYQGPILIRGHQMVALIYYNLTTTRGQASIQAILPTRRFHRNIKSWVVKMTQLLVG